MNRAVSSRCDGFTVFIIKEALFGVLHGDGVSPRKQTSNGAYELSTAIRRSASKKLPETDVGENWKFAQPYPCKSVFWSSFHG